MKPKARREKQPCDGHQASEAPSDDMPLLDHALGDPTIFTPEELVEAVRRQRGLKAVPIPDVCVLEFDGDLTDELVSRNEVQRCEVWPCFHTAMWIWQCGGQSCGIVARTIGGPYAVLVAEQLAVCGAKVIVGLTSAGRISPALPVPGIVVADQAIRDEGTSLHYLPPGEIVAASAALAQALEAEVAHVGLPVRRGLVWTTDAPYRETARQFARHARRGALAVEMQAASLFAFAARRNIAAGVVAHVTNAPDHDGEAFDKGSSVIQREILAAICRAGYRSLGTMAGLNTDG